MRGTRSPRRAFSRLALKVIASSKDDRSVLWVAHGWYLSREELFVCLERRRGIRPRALSKADGIPGSWPRRTR